MIKVVIDVQQCTRCGKCVSICPNNALEFDGEYPLLLKPDQCTECGICEDQCPTGAITLTTKMHRDVSGPEIRGDKTYIEISESLKDYCT